MKTRFYCQNCGAQSAKWIGKCSACQEWNTYVEEVVDSGKPEKFAWDSEKTGKKAAPSPKPISSIEESRSFRWKTADAELDRVLGGGIVPGSVVLIGGEPGIGKSTLMLQLAMSLSTIRTLYVSGEESERQIKLRANRLGLNNEEVYVLTETSTRRIFKHAKKLEPQVMILDSIQTLQSHLIDSTPGSVSQIRECAGELQRFAKETNTPVFLVGHITKDGAIAGPKILEHIVDTVLQFEGDQNYTYRILRTTKNRYGSTSEIGIYDMTGDGLRPVNNPSEVLITRREEQLSGIAIGATIEGMRPLLIESQALVTNAFYGTPQRSATGFDSRRLNMLLAVLEKRCGFTIGTKDVFLNIAGGLRIIDPAIDLAIICALMSSFEDVAIPPQYVFVGEVGLSGEIRAVNRIEQRISEADKLGFEKIFISKHNQKGLHPSRFDIEVVQIGKVHEAYRYLFQSVGV